MSTSSHRKGAQWERDGVALWKDAGFPRAERTYGAGRPDDIGDVRGVPGLTQQFKNHRRFELATWMDEVKVQMRRAGNQFGIVVLKRRLRPTSQSYVIMELGQFAELYASRDRMAASLSSPALFVARGVEHE